MRIIDKTTGARDSNLRRAGFSPPDAKIARKHGIGRLKPAVQTGAKPRGEAPNLHFADPLCSLCLCGESPSFYLHSQ